MYVILKWNKGPAQGGGGTAGLRDDVPWWTDGDLIIAIIETTAGREFAALRVHADEGLLSFTDGIGNEFDASSSDIHWWALLTPLNTPPEL